MDRWDTIERKEYLLKVFVGHTWPMIAHLNYDPGKSKRTLPTHRDFHVGAGGCVYWMALRITFSIARRSCSLALVAVHAPTESTLTARSLDWGSKFPSTSTALI